MGQRRACYAYMHVKQVDHYTGKLHWCAGVVALLSTAGRPSVGCQCGGCNRRSDDLITYVPLSGMKVRHRGQ